MNKSSIPAELPVNCVKAIQAFISEKFGDFANLDNPIGSKIFDIIERKGCIVVFYPSDGGEKNDAFLLSDMPMRNGGSTNVIVINTGQTVEKQVFAAGHELGHLMHVCDYVDKMCSQRYDEELIVNRFAAELLMPAPDFKKKMETFLSEYDATNSHRIKLEDIIRIILNAMLYYKVPYNAVVIRMYEVGVIAREAASLLVDGNSNIPLTVLERIREKIKSEDRYTEIQAISKKCEIKGLKELLERAENQGVSSSKIERLKDTFCIVSDSDQNKEINVSI